MGRNKDILAREEGQSMVEYLLLITVVVSLAMAIFKSDLYVKFMGANSPYFITMKNYFEYTYRFGSEGTQINPTYNTYTDTNPLYIDDVGSQSRFFLPSEEYGN